MMTLDQQCKMFGCTVAELNESIEDTLDVKMLAISILSDSQEVLVRGDSETARQYINQAKYVISNIRI